MFTRRELKDLELMVEDYRDRCRTAHNSPVSTESIKRMYANEILKAEEMLTTINENVRTLEIERDEARSVS